MKKVIIFLVIIVVLFVAIAFMNNLSNSSKSEDNPYGKNRLNQATIEQLDDENYQSIILPEELEEKLDNKEDAVVYFYSPECIYCKEATPKVVEAVNQLDVELAQYNLLEFNDGFNDYNIESTPTLVVFEDGEEKDRFTGSADMEVYLDFIEKNIK